MDILEIGMKIKTSELTGAALDWAVAKCEGLDYWYPEIGPSQPEYSTDWSQGEPIIEREGIKIHKGNDLYFPKGNEKSDYYEPLWVAGKQHGQTPLIAAMRCYVASKLGDTVELPQDLIN